jgi:hypothetical protein
MQITSIIFLAQTVWQVKTTRNFAKHWYSFFPHGKSTYIGLSQPIYCKKKTLSECAQKH